MDIEIMIMAAALFIPFFLGFFFLGVIYATIRSKKYLLGLLEELEKRTKGGE